MTSEFVKQKTSTVENNWVKGWLILLEVSSLIFYFGKFLFECSQVFWTIFDNFVWDIWKLIIYMQIEVVWFLRIACFLRKINL
jgi:hypothetical protein